MNLNGDYCSSCFESINFNKVQIVDMKGNYTFKFVISKDSNINLGTFDFENMVEINIYHSMIINLKKLWKILIKI